MKNRLNNYIIKRYLESDYKEVLEMFVKFQDENNVDIVSSSSHFLSKNEKRKRTEKSFKFHIGPSRKNYLVFDTDLSKIVGFTSFEGNNLQLVFKNVDYYLGKNTINAQRQLINTYCEQYNIKKLESVIFKRKKYKTYRKWVQRCFQTEEINETDKYTSIKYKIPLDIIE